MLNFELVRAGFPPEWSFNEVGALLRAKVPGGWIIWIRSDMGGLTFYPDPQHVWDGTSLR